MVISHIYQFDTFCAGFFIANIGKCGTDDTIFIKITYNYLSSA